MVSYQLQVTVNGSMLWDSGKVVGGKTSTNVAYDGSTALASDATYQWSVQWWDETGAAAPLASAHFSTAMLGGYADFKGAEWVAGRMLRAEFSVVAPADATVVRARLFISGLGAYKSYLNGHVTDPHELSTFTVYEHRVEYDVWDVTEHVHSGCNALGVLIGSWYWASKGETTAGKGSPTLLVLLSVETSDGKRSYYPTRLEGSSPLKSASAVEPDVLPLHFTTATSPITTDGVGSFSYDASLEQPGWNTCAFAPVKPWTAAAPGFNALSVNPRGGTPLFTANSVYISIERDFPIVAINPMPDGSHVVDFGQNMAAFVSIKAVCLQGPQTITLTFAETLQADGTILKLYGGTETFVCAGTGDFETVTPHFGYSGMRYALVENWPGALNFDSLTAHFVHANLPQVGSFSSSSELLNKIQHATRFSSLSNLQQSPTDCPTREKNGYLGDGGMTALTVSHNFETAAYYSRWMRDVRDAIAYPAGMNETCVSNVVPIECRNQGGEQCQKGGCASSDPSWTVGYPTTINLVHQLYDDDRIVERNFADVLFWVNVLAEQLTNLSSPQPYTLQQQPIGDWAAPRPAPERSNDHDESTFMWIYGTEILLGWAERNGNSSVVAKYSDLINTTKTWYHRNFFDNATGGYRDHMSPQGSTGFMPLSQMLALRLGIVPEEKQQALFDFLIELVEGKQPGPSAVYPNHSAWGIVTQRYAYETFSKFGRTDKGLQVLLQTDFPSIGRWINQGATTLWETWGNNATAPCTGCPDSYNHIMFGTYGAWLYPDIAGLGRGANSLSWKDLVLKPGAFQHPDVTFAAASIDSPIGLASIEWIQEPDYPTWFGLEPQHFGYGGVPTEKSLTLTCRTTNSGRSTFKGVTFASFGAPGGNATDPSSFNRSTGCDHPNSTAVVTALCVGKSVCTIPLDPQTFGDPKVGPDSSWCPKPPPGFKGPQLAVAMSKDSCDGTVVLTVKGSIPVGGRALFVLPIGAATADAVAVLSDNSSVVFQGGKYVAGVAGVGGAAISADGAHVDVITSSGNYEFTVLNQGAVSKPSIAGRNTAGAISPQCSAPLNDTIFVGYDIPGQKVVPSAAACCALCANVTGCVVWNWYGGCTVDPTSCEKGLCLLKTSAKGRAPSNHGPLVVGGCVLVDGKCPVPIPGLPPSPSPPTPPSPTPPTPPPAPVQLVLK
jgi:alpha-L-rhamnosidase